MAGANLGHWISQYGRQREEHWDTYIRESDVARMKAWGMDHVRVPVDYFLFEDDANPGVYDETRLGYIDRVLAWCRNNGMNMILDLHHAPGFFFGDGAKNDLFTNPASQERFIAIWRMFAKRYEAEGDNLIFELLNELVWDSSEPWNALWQKTAAAIHAIAPARRIIVGGNYWNSVNQLKNLALVNDDRIIYNFHYYGPFLFTHQRAGWIEHNRNYTKPVSYPFDPMEHLGFFGGKLPDEFRDFSVIDKAYLAKDLQPVFDFIEATGRTVYCGEYGVIANADDASAARWLSDMADLFLEHGIGHAVWSYRGFSAITSADDRTWNQSMVDAVARR